VTNDVELRAPTDADEVRTALDAIGADFTIPFDHTDARMQRILEQPTTDNPLLVVATLATGVICGAAFAIRSGADGAPLATIGVTATYRVTGLGRRLVEHIEAACIKSAMHKSPPGSVTSRYGDDEQRHRRLQELRDRRAARST